jgi:hypothetical protein
VYPVLHTPLYKPNAPSFFITWPNIWTMFNFAPCAGVACVCNRTWVHEYMGSAHAIVRDTFTIRLSVFLSYYTRCRRSLPRSSGCVKNVAKQLALPPNQKGYRIGVFFIGFTSSLFRNPGTLTFLVTSAIMIVRSEAIACS